MSCNLSHGDLSHLQLYTHPVDILVALQGAQKGRPLQGLLVGSRSSEGDGITVTKFIPFERFGQHLSTLMNLYISTGTHESIAGWCLLLDRECHLARLAAPYFESFTRHLVRVIITNSPVSASSLYECAQEIADLLRPMVGLMAVREHGNDFVTREFCAFQNDITIDRIISIMQEQAVTELDLLSGTDSSSLPYSDELDGISRMAINELMDQLRAEELECPETLAAIEDAVKGVRRTRRRRPSLTVTEESTNQNPTSPKQQQQRSKTPNILPIPVNIISGASSEFLESISIPSMLMGLSIDASITAKEEYLRRLQDGLVSRLEAYENDCKEYELLLLVYKVLSQPDEVLLRKMSTIEDYEERLKKLGAKLCHSLSPEDILRTLASIS